MRRLSVGALALGMMAGVAGCASTVSQHGYLPETDNFAAQISPGSDTKTTVLARLGSPSSTGVFSGESWYYITTVQQRRAFFNPETTQREIVAVRFGENDTVESIETFNLEDGRLIEYAEQVTPTRGRELGWLEQLFGNVGRTPAQIGAEETGRENRR